MQKLFCLFLAMLVMSTTTFALKDPICGLPHSQDGDNDLQCRGRFPLFSYNSDAKECVSFIYGGCGGNENRFSSKELCEEKCKE
uniref:BPTI/Kunitz inhibitor domain-containing protein n=1 Tax=Musca domestica TaxID=7370 RepID=A0A1I8N2I1_MUSDO